MAINLKKEKEVDEVHLPRVFPQWVIDLVEKHGGSELQFLMEKTLTKSDVVPQQNRLIIPRRYMEAHVLPMLSDEEKAAANVLDDGPCIKKMASSCDGDGPDGEDGDRNERAMKRRKKEKGREHEGLGVCMYVRSGWAFRVALTRWDSSPSRVLKGDEWRMVRLWGELKDGDTVEMWGFRQGPNRELSFVIAKKSVPETCIK